MGLTLATKNKLGVVTGNKRGTELGVKISYNNHPPQRYVLLAASGSQYSEMVHVRKGNEIGGQKATMPLRLNQ